MSLNTMVELMIGQLLNSQQLTLEDKTAVISDIYKAILASKLNKINNQQIKVLSENLIRHYKSSSAEIKVKITSILVHIISLASTGLDLCFSSNKITDEDAKTIAIVLENANLPQGFNLDLSKNLIGDKGAQTIATALRKASLPQGFNLDPGLFFTDEKGIKVLARVLCLNPALHINAPTLDSSNNINQKILDFAKTDYLAQDKIELEVVNTRQEIIQDIINTLRNHPSSILNLLKWLTKESTTAMFTSWQNYNQLAHVIHEVLSSKQEELHEYHDDILSLTKNTWLEDTVIGALGFSCYQGDREHVNAASTNEATLLIRDILAQDKQVLKLFVDHALQNNGVLELLQCIVFGSNQEVQEKKPEQAIAHSELMQLMNILLARPVNPRLPQLSTEDFPDITKTISQLKKLNNILFGYAACNAVKEVVSAPLLGLVTQVGIFKPTMPNEGLPDIPQANVAKRNPGKR